MNTRRLLLACTLLFGSALHAATPADYHAELRALKTTYENAINSGDLAPLATLFDADTTGVTVDNQSFRSFAELKAIYELLEAVSDKCEDVANLIEGVVLETA